MREELSEIGTAGKAGKFTTIEDLHLNENGTDAFIKEHIEPFETIMME